MTIHTKLWHLLQQAVTLIGEDQCEQWVDEAVETLAEIDELGGWVPWKAGDPLPMPQFHTAWLCTVRRRGTVDPTWLEIRRGGEWMFDDGTSTEVIAYLPDPLPQPYEPPTRVENPNHDLQKRRRGRKVQFSWGDVYNRHVAKGEDHASAAYAADEAEKRAKRTT